jgi:hypothetical protein
VNQRGDHARLDDLPQSVVVAIVDRDTDYVLHSQLSHSPRSILAACPTDFIDGILRAPGRGGGDYEPDGIAGRTPKQFPIWRETGDRDKAQE